MRKQNIDITSAISVDVEANDKLKRPNSRSVCWQNFVCHQPCYRNVTAIVPDIDRALLNRALGDARKRFQSDAQFEPAKGKWRMACRVSYGSQESQLLPQPAEGALQ